MGKTEKQTQFFSDMKLSAKKANETISWRELEYSREQAYAIALI